MLAGGFVGGAAYGVLTCPQGGGQGECILGNAAAGLAAGFVGGVAGKAIVKAASRVGRARVVSSVVEGLDGGGAQSQLRRVLAVGEGSAKGVPRVADDAADVIAGLPGPTGLVEKPGPAAAGLIKLANQADEAANKGMLGVRAAGEAGEAAAGIVKNTTRIPSASGKAAYRIPDELSSTVLGEVKNVSHLNYTSQLRDFAEYAKQAGLTFKLYTRGSTTFSGTLQAEIDAGRIVLDTTRLGL